MPVRGISEKLEKKIFQNDVFVVSLSQKTIQQKKTRAL
jgi:hypothetical protein